MKKFIFPVLLFVILLTTVLVFQLCTAEIEFTVYYDCEDVCWNINFECYSGSLTDAEEASCASNCNAAGFSQSTINCGYLANSCAEITECGISTGM